MFRFAAPVSPRLCAKVVCFLIAAGFHTITLGRMYTSGPVVLPWCNKISSKLFLNFRCASLSKWSIFGCEFPLMDGRGDDMDWPLSDDIFLSLLVSPVTIIICNICNYIVFWIPNISLTRKYFFFLRINDLPRRYLSQY